VVGIQGATDLFGLFEETLRPLIEVAHAQH
jgi:hypothetical protein